MKTIVFIPLTQGYVAAVDWADFNLVRENKWQASKRQNGRVYATRVERVEPTGKRQRIYMHAVIAGAKGVDHRDGDGLNNTRENLRAATHAENFHGFCRKKPGCSSNYRGVGWHKQHNKWEARIRVKGKLHWLGEFTDEENAAKAYDAAVIKFGFFKESMNFKPIC